MKSSQPTDKATRQYERDYGFPPKEPCADLNQRTPPLWKDLIVWSFLPVVFFACGAAIMWVILESLK